MLRIVKGVNGFLALPKSLGKAAIEFAGGFKKLIPNFRDLAPIARMGALIVVVGLPIFWVVYQFVLTPMNIGIGTLLTGVRESQEQRRYDREYSSAIGNLESELRATRSALKVSRQRTDRLNAQLETVQASVADRESELLEAIGAIGEVTVPEAIQEIAPVEFQELEPCNVAVASSMNLIDSLYKERDALEQKINLQIEALSILTNQVNINESKFRAAETRIKQFRKRRFRWGPGAGVSIDQHMNVRPTIGLFLIWG